MPAPSTSPARHLIGLLALLLPAAAVLGQGPPVVPRPPGAPGGGPAGAGASAPAPLVIEAPPSLESVLKNGLTFPSASIIQIVLPVYQMLTGRKVILDTNIADNVVRIVLQGPVEKEEAVEFIEQTLLLNGYVFLPTHRPDTFKLLNAAGGNPRAEPARVFREGDVLPETEEMITYIMPLQYIKPDEAIRIFPQVLQLHAYGALTAVPNASAVVITENVALIRKMIALKEAVDVPAGQVDHKFFELERADAERVAEMLRETLNVEGEQGARAVRSQTGQPAPPAPAPTGGAEGGRPAAPSQAGTTIDSDGPAVKILADTRTNGILAVARPIDLKYIETLIGIFDAPSKARRFLNRPLEFVKATEILGLIEDALQSTVGDSTSTSGGRSGARSNTTVRGGADVQARDLGGSQLGGSQFGGSGRSGSGGGANLGSSLGSPQAVPLVESALVGKTLVVADNERNALIVSGPPESVTLVEELADQLDQRPRQIYLATVIGQMSMGDDLQIGISAVRALEQLNGREELLGAGSFNPGQAPPGAEGGLLDIGSLTDPSLFPTSPDGLNLYGKIAGNLDLYVNLLESTNKFRVLSRPQIFTANNRKAIIQSGQRIPVPTNTFTSGGINTGSQSTNIDYRDVVLKLEVIPQINSKNEVTLQVAQTNDNIVGSRQIDNNLIDVIGTQEILTTVTISNGQTVVLGGLISEQVEKTMKGIPGLIHIPVLKHLFGNTVDKKTRSELLIFIQPQIVEDDVGLLGANVREIRRAEGADDILDFAIPDYEEMREALPKAAPPAAAAKKRGPVSPRSLFHP
jgi:general secretion pathway protein D